nr:MAG TPA: hypothetical protein [Caudoviricetes sp.]DAZ52652.1 MAG TPA: hypothetical protein [Caudoviricetes sp.]
MMTRASASDSTKFFKWNFIFYIKYLCFIFCDFYQKS